MRAVLAVAAFCALSQPSHAQQREVIHLREGGQTLVRASGSFSSVVIGNPDVADALPRSDNQVLLVGKKLGTSDIMIFGDNRVLFHGAIVVGPPEVSGKVIVNNKKDLSLYNAYICNPVCTRTEDKFEVRQVPEITINTPGGPPGINLTVPPIR